MPLTTTKSDIDVNSSIYKAVKAEMMDLSKTVISYLRKLKSDEERDAVIADTVEVRVSELSQRTYSVNFNAPPAASIAQSNTLVNITYKREKRLVEKVMKALEVNSNREVGERTFDYYLDEEIGK